MKNWFAGMFASTVAPATTNVVRVAPMPVKKPVNAQVASPSGAPHMRGTQYSSASASIRGAR